MGRIQKDRKLNKVTILKLAKYRGAAILVQNYQNLFQVVIFFQDKFYQSHNIITPVKHKFHSNTDLLKGTSLMLYQAFVTIDALSASKPSDLEPKDETKNKASKNKLN